MSEPTRAERILHWLDAVRRLVVSALFWGAVAAVCVLAVLTWRARPRVPDGAALVLTPRGLLVEELSGDPEALLARTLAGAGGPSEVLMRDVLDGLRLAAEDPRIAALVVDADDLSGGLSKLRTVGEAVSAFRASGKKVIAYSEQLGEAAFYLGARADELFLHPDALVLVDGYGGYRPYYKEGLDRYGVRLHVFRVGEYKSAVEPYLRNDMSPEAKEASRAVYDDLWGLWLSDVAAARGLDPSRLRTTIDEWPRRLADAGGDMARAALDASFVDGLGARDRLRARMIEIVGKDEDEGHTFRQVALPTYLAARSDARRPRTRGAGVAIVVARGEILDGSHPPGTVGGDSTAALLRRAREDDDARAIVLRVDSPGGSAFASEVIRRECELAREAGKPVVVSMGSLAASGGYWISTSSDEIWASPATITGSIGIFGVFPDVHEALARYLGVHLDGVGTTPWTDALNPGKPLAPEVAGVIQGVVDDGYEDFLDRVAAARGMPREKVDEIARGRVWSGQDARELGLVDELGDLDDAVASAARRAKLEEGYRVFYVEKPPSLRTRLLRSLVRLTGGLPGPEPASAPPGILQPERILARAAAEIERLGRWNDPRGAYAHCLCGEEWPSSF